jgi:hypothetical protein
VWPASAPSKVVGQSTSDSFEAVSTSIAGSTVEVELTPKEKRDKAKADYQATMADAKATKADTVADANATYQAEVAANESLPNRAGKQAANKQAKADFNAAKKQATNTCKASVSAAKSAKAAAKAEYKDTN